MENIVIKIPAIFEGDHGKFSRSSRVVSICKAQCNIIPVLLYHALSCRGDDGNYCTRIGNSREVKIGLWKVIQKSVMEEELLGKQRCVLRRFKGMLIISPIIILFL